MKQNFANDGVSLCKRWEIRRVRSKWEEEASDAGRNGREDFWSRKTGSQPTAENWRGLPSARVSSAKLLRAKEIANSGGDAKALRRPGEVNRRARNGAAEMARAANIFGVDWTNSELFRLPRGKRWGWQKRRSRPLSVSALK